MKINCCRYYHHRKVACVSRNLAEIVGAHNFSVKMQVIISPDASVESEMLVFTIHAFNHGHNLKKKLEDLLMNRIVLRLLFFKYVLIF